MQLKNEQVTFYLLFIVCMLTAKRIVSRLAKPSIHFTSYYKAYILALTIEHLHTNGRGHNIPYIHGMRTFGV